MLPSIRCAPNNFGLCSVQLEPVQLHPRRRYMQILAPGAERLLLDVRSHRSAYGWRTCVATDQGKNFESKLIHELFLLAGIEKSKTTPFHPRSDGQAERLNRTLLQMLRTTATDHVNNWPSYMPTVLSSISHDSTFSHWNHTEYGNVRSRGILLHSLLNRRMSQ